MTSSEVAWNMRIGGDVTSSPEVADGMVYTRVGENVLFALDTATGEERWRFPTGGIGGCILDTGPVVVDGVVYMTTIDSELEGSLFAIDAETSDQLWSFVPGSPGLNTPAVVDGVVYAGGDSGIYAVDAASGDRIWNAPFGEGFSAPAVGEDLVVMHTRNELVAVDASSGEECWRYETSGSWSASTLVDGIVYVGSQGMGRIGLHLVGAATERERWHVRAMGSMKGSPVVAGGVVYAAGDSGLFGFDTSQPGATPGRETTIATTISRLAFATMLDESGAPSTPDPGVLPVPHGWSSFSTIWEFLRKPPTTSCGSSTVSVSTRVRRRGHCRKMETPIARFPPSRGRCLMAWYEVVISVDGVEMQRGTVAIGAG